MIPGNKDAFFAAISLHVSSLLAARNMCDKGILWEAQLFNCEPFATDLRVTQCYNCQEYGHIARYCRKEGRCGLSAATKHEGGEEACPVKWNGSPPKCVNCNGRHTA